MANQVVKVSDNHNVWCYGPVRPMSQFEIECEDQVNDGTYYDGNPDAKNGFKNWTEVVEFLLEHWSDDVIKVTAI